MDLVREEDLPHYLAIASVKHREYIREICCDLHRIGQIKSICMAIIFNDAERFNLSNMPRWATHYYCLGGNRADEVFNIATYKQQDYFIPRSSAYDIVQHTLVSMEENLYGHYDTFAIIRQCSDCKFIFLALHDHPVAAPEELYKRCITSFAMFCCTFVTKTLVIIKAFNPDKQHLPIFNNSAHRQRVITKQPEYIMEPITSREKQMMKYLSHNASITTIAEQMSISPKTVRNKIHELTQKFYCHSKSELIEIINNTGLV